MEKAKGPDEAPRSVLRDAIYLEHSSVDVREEDGATRQRYSVLRGDVLHEMDLSPSDTTAERTKLSVSVVPAIQQYALSLGKNDITNQTIQAELEGVLNRLGLAPRSLSADDFKRISEDILWRVYRWKTNPQYPFRALRLLLVVTPSSEHVPNHDAPVQLKMKDMGELIRTKVADFFTHTPNLHGWSDKKYGLKITLASSGYSTVAGKKPEEIASELVKIVNAFRAGQLFEVPPSGQVKLQIIFAEDCLEKERPPEARPLRT